MAYDYEELEKQAIALIEEHSLFSLLQVIGFLSISSSTFYNYGLEKSNGIRDAIRKSKSKEFVEAFKRLKGNESAAAQIATCKVLGDQDIRDALNGKIEDRDQKEVKVVVEHKPIQSRADITDG